MILRSPFFTSESISFFIVFMHSLWFGKLEASTIQVGSSI